MAKKISGRKARANQYFSNAATCSKKAPHATKEEALEAARRIERVVDDGFTLRVYKCLFCGEWHKTKKKKDKQHS